MSDLNGASTLRGRTVLALREMVLRGQLAPRKRLEEFDLSRSLGVSRPVLRSALDHLASEGLLEPTPSGGYAARHFTLEDIRDAILARSALEALAAGLAAKRIQDPSELEPARKLNAQLAEAILTVKHRRGRIHPATQVFQALRIAVNDELGALQSGLSDAVSLLRSGGRLGVITFHSIEDRLVKRWMKTEAAAGELEIMTKHVVGPDRDEQLSNPRSRSAKLRVAQKN